MQITIDIPDDIARQLTETPEQLQRDLLERFVIEAYRAECITHFQVQQILQLPSRWAVDAFLKTHQANLHYNEADLGRDRETLSQLKAKRAIDT